MIVTTNMMIMRATIAARSCARLQIQNVKNELALRGEAVESHKSELLLLESSKRYNPCADSPNCCRVCRVTLRAESWRSRRCRRDSRF
jgi:hypothetical protein